MGVEAGVDELGDGAGFSCSLQWVWALKLEGWLWVLAEDLASEKDGRACRGGGDAVYCCEVGEGEGDCELKWEGPGNGDVGDAVGCDREAEAEALACCSREG